MLDVRDLARRPGQHRVVTSTVKAPAELGTDVIGVPEGAAVELDLRLEAVLEGVLVSGVVRAPLLGECVRCLGAVHDVTEVGLAELFAHSGEAVQGGDDEVRELQDETIDLEPAVRDAVVLALPFQPVCRADCAGLCPDCGVRLDDDPGHRHDSADPRWAVLESLRVDVGSTQAGPKRPDRTKEN